MRFPFPKLSSFFFIFFYALLHSVSVYSQGSGYSDTEIAHSLHKNVSQNENVSDLIDNALPTVLPFGLSKTIGGEKQTVVLDSVSFTPEGGFLTAYSVVSVPKTGDTLAFKVSDAQFSTGGFTGDARLVLLEDVNLDIGDSTTLSVKADEQKTYVDWDCNGFNELGIDCEVSFSREFVVPENPDGTPDTTGQQVITEFETQVQSWDDLLIDVSLPPLQFTKLKGFGFNITRAVFDFSETKNSVNMIFPAAYVTPSMLEANSPMWEGFFLEQMQIKLPPEFKNKNSNERITISADNLLIDELGVTGSFSGYNI